jgi:hypothetical protein
VLRPVVLLLGISAISLAAFPHAAADTLRYRFVPAGADGSVKQVPAGPGGAVGELRTGFAMEPQPYQVTHRANQMVTFRHPSTGRNVTIPLTLPEGTPRVEHRGGDRIVFNYGTYTIDIRFIAGGGLDVIYNSGFLRPLRLY